jgi:hypothetical protein
MVDHSRMILLIIQKKNLSRAPEYGASFKKEQRMTNDGGNHHHSLE